MRLPTTDKSILTIGNLEAQPVRRNELLNPTLIQKIITTIQDELEQESLYSAIRILVPFALLYPEFNYLWQPYQSIIEDRLRSETRMNDVEKIVTTRVLDLLCLRAVFSNSPMFDLDEQLFANVQNEVHRNIVSRWMFPDALRAHFTAQVAFPYLQLNMNGLGRKGVRYQENGPTIIHDAARKRTDEISKISFTMMYASLVFHSDLRERNGDGSITDYLYDQLNAAITITRSPTLMAELALAINLLEAEKVSISPEGKLLLSVSEGREYSMEPSSVDRLF